MASYAEDTYGVVQRVSQRGASGWGLSARVELTAAVLLKLRLQKTF